MLPEINRIYKGDALDVLRGWPDGFVHMCVTPPPYWALRDYGTASWEGGDPGCAHTIVEPTADNKAVFDDRPKAGDRTVCRLCGARRIDSQAGLENTPAEYVDRMVTIFREVRRVLRPDGTLWLNLGDSYCSRPFSDGPDAHLKAKDLVGIPWRVAFAMQADGWYLRSDIVWSKGNPMPESIRDRPTRSYEFVFLFSKESRYYYDPDAIREEHVTPACMQRIENYRAEQARSENIKCTGGSSGFHPLGRNARSVWTVNTHPFEAHFATFPEKLIERPILAGTSARGCCTTCGAPYERIVERVHGKDWNAHKTQDDRMTTGRGTGAAADKERIETPPKTIGRRPSCSCAHKTERAPCIVLDPFMGAGTTAKVALRAGRAFLGIDLNDQYIALAERRIDHLLRQTDLFSLSGDGIS